MIRDSKVDGPTFHVRHLTLIIHVRSFIATVMIRNRFPHPKDSLVL